MLSKRTSPSDFLKLHITRWRSLAVLVCGLCVGGCGIFGADEDEEIQPNELLEFDATLDVRRVWAQKLGKGSEFLRIGLRPASDGNRVFAASYDGNVLAFDSETGDRAWSIETETLLSAGPGVGDGIVVVAGYDGDVIALRADDGTEVWRINISAETLAPPSVRDDVIAISTIDGRMRTFSAFNGSEIWSLEQASPSLTQRGTSTPTFVGTTIVSGFDNGRLVASSVSDGTMQWEAILTPPAGRSDLDRLADVDGAIAVVGQDIYASGYNGRTAAIAAESGQVLWDREISSHAGLTADWNNIYAVGNTGELMALVRRNGSDLWRQDALLNREPTPPVVFSSALVVGDFEGYVHFFSLVDGQPAARVRLGKAMISSAPLVLGDKLFVQSESGELAAFTVVMPERPEPEPDPEPETPPEAETGEEN